jgi:hypothetical protein
MVYMVSRDTIQTVDLTDPALFIQITEIIYLLWVAAMIIAKNHRVHDSKFAPELHSWIFFLLVRFNLDLLENFAQRRRRRHTVRNSMPNLKP